MTGGGDRRPPRSRRLFIAVEVPPAVHAVVDESLEPWRATAGARWVPSERRHVTIRFLGSVAAGEIDLVRRALGSSASAVAPIQTHLTGLGAFPSPRRARVLWAGVDDRAGRLAGLAMALDGALPPAFRTETRAFRPHLTVARCEPPARLPDHYTATALEPLGFQVDEAVLFERVADGSGPPRYEALERVGLMG